MTWTWTRITGLLIRWWLPLSLTLGMSAGIVWTLTRDVVYAADAYVVVVAGGDPAQAADFAAAYARISAHPGLLSSEKAEQDALSVAASPDTPLLRLSSTGANGWQAADRVNRAAGTLIAYANAHTTDTRVRLASFASAAPPMYPATPALPLSMALGAGGAALVAGIIRLAATPARQETRRESAPALSGAQA
ncbi:hypothetical protein ACFOY2_23125 [Nonomuraea purpurea]|uniref:Lipopolysaccharide biosynthesis protein n=1 Tax=Nonomuraea purpurea TaxID=1849276 RepID=A0ABV8GDB9_9ACTN